MNVTEILKENMSDLFSQETLVESGYIALGSSVNPIISGVLTGAISKVIPNIPVTGIGAKGIDLISAALTTTIAAFSLRNPKITRNVLYGAVAGIANDVFSEEVLPRIGLSDFLTEEDVQGVSSYLTEEDIDDLNSSDGHVGQFLTEEDIENVDSGVGDYLTEEDIAI